MIIFSDICLVMDLMTIGEHLGDALLGCLMR